jgi:predicted enzyme related to lactoylglutathione lyase
MSDSANVVSWFEIPATNFARAQAFYGAVLGRTIEPMVMGPITMGFYRLTPTPWAVPSCMARAHRPSWAPSFT